MASCTRALERINAGIDLIETSILAEEAFRFANRAMWQQRIHSTFSRKVRKKEMKVEDGVTALDQPGIAAGVCFSLPLFSSTYPA